MRLIDLRCLAVALLTAVAAGAVAQRPTTALIPPQAESTGRVPDIFEDVTQLERVEANITREIVKKFQVENPSHREFAPNLVSQGYEEDESSPALKLTKISVGTAGVLLELTGLARARNSVSAVMRRDTLQLKSSTGQTSALLAFEGVTELRDRRGGSALIVNPGDKLYLLFDKFDDYFAFSLSHVNRDGLESVYFAQLDPRFVERYDALYSAASTPNGMKDFVVEFARNDPSGRVLPVFAKLLGQMRAQNSFEGYHTAFQLLGETRDYAAMQRTAKSAEHHAVVQSIEAEKEAELRRREETRLAEVRRQEAQQMAQQRAEQARLAEQRCLATPACLREMEERRAACGQSVQRCRAQCDRLSGSGSYGSFFANLAAAGISAACSRGCKCDNNFGDLLAKFNDMSSGGSAGTGRTAPPTAVAAAPSLAAASTKATALTATKPSAPNVDAARRPIEAAPAKQVPVPVPQAAVNHQCAVNCRAPDGKAWITVKASDATEAAKLVDPQGHEVCKAAGHQRATDARMSASQCRRQ